jgi:hypothetical protein
MEQMYAAPVEVLPKEQRSDSSDASKERDRTAPAQVAKVIPETTEKITGSAAGKILSSGGFSIATLLSLLFGLAYVVRSLKNVKLTLLLRLKRDDRAEKKY